MQAWLRRRGVIVHDDQEGRGHMDVPAGTITEKSSNPFAVISAWSLLPTKNQYNALHNYSKI